MNDINLLASRRQKSSRKKQYLKWLNSASLLILILVAFSAVTVFLLTVLSPYQALDKKAADTKIELDQMNNRAVKVYLISDRAAGLKTLIEQRPRYYEYADALLQALPTDVSVEQFSIDRGSLTFSASTNSLLSLDTFFSRLINHIENKTFFKSVLLNSLLADTKENKYTVSLTVALL